MVSNIATQHLQFSLTSIICLHTIKWSHSSIWLKDATTTLGQSGGPGSNGNKEVLHIPQTSRTGAIALDGLVPYQGHSLGKGPIPLQRSNQRILQHQPTG